MRRRHFLRLLGTGIGATATGFARAEPAMPMIGFLNSTSSTDFAPFVAAFYAGLSETGYVEHETVAIEYRWAEGHFDRLPALAADLVGRRVAVLVATGGTVSALAAKAATTMIPIVFAIGSDPVNAGLVGSIGRPGGNVTGATLLAPVLTTKQLELLRALIPRGSTMAILENPSNGANVEQALKEATQAAKTAGQQILIVNAGSGSEIDTAFAGLAQQGAKGLLIPGDPLFIARRDQLVALAARHAIPTIYFEREFAASGGLISYGGSIAELFHQAGVYTGRILRGAKPTDLPVIQPAKFELVINLTTAKTLGLEVRPALLAIADEVIE
jgi:putative tryptophan/tyrosine transport system substrate-binding protein